MKAKITLFQLSFKTFLYSLLITINSVNVRPLESLFIYKITTVGIFPLNIVGRWNVIQSNL